MPIDIIGVVGDGEDATVIEGDMANTYIWRVGYRLAAAASLASSANIRDQHYEATLQQNIRDTLD
jgi:hypothetical protein